MAVTAPRGLNAGVVPMAMSMPIALVTRIHFIRLGALPAAVVKDASVAHGGGILRWSDIRVRFRAVEKVVN